MTEQAKAEAVEDALSGKPRTSTRYRIRKAPGDTWYYADYRLRYWPFWVQIEGFGAEASARHAIKQHIIASGPTKVKAVTVDDVF